MRQSLFFSRVTFIVADDIATLKCTYNTMIR